MLGPAPAAEPLGAKSAAVGIPPERGGGRPRVRPGRPAPLGAPLRGGRAAPNTPANIPANTPATGPGTAVLARPGRPLPGPSPGRPPADAPRLPPLARDPSARAHAGDRARQEPGAG